jgi:hypothetical protein
VLNGSPDPTRPVIHLGKAIPPPRKATLLEPLARPKAIRFHRAGRGQPRAIILSQPLPYLSFAVLEW